MTRNSDYLKLSLTNAIVRRMVSLGHCPINFRYMIFHSLTLSHRGHDDHILEVRFDFIDDRSYMSETVEYQSPGFQKSDVNDCAEYLCTALMKEKGSTVLSRHFAAKPPGREIND